MSNFVGKVGGGMRGRYIKLELAEEKVPVSSEDGVTGGFFEKGG